MKEHSVNQMQDFFRLSEYWPFIFTVLVRLGKKSDKKKSSEENGIS